MSEIATKTIKTTSEELQTPATSFQTSLEKSNALNKKDSKESLQIRPPD